MTTTLLFARLRPPMDVGAFMRGLATLCDVSSVELVGVDGNWIRLAVQHDDADLADHPVHRQPSLDRRVNALDGVTQVWVR